MAQRDRQMVQSFITAIGTGAFAGMAVLGWLMFFDVSSIGTMVQSDSTSPIFSTLIISGSLLKGGLVGFAFGLTALSIQPKREMDRDAVVVARTAR